MLRSVGSKVARVGRTASMVFGLALVVALVMALVLGVASMALGANGDFFKVGRANVASAVSTLDKSGAGPALRLLVDSGPPLAVNSSTRVANLNADQIDGKDSSGFVQGNATVRYRKVEIPAGTSAKIIDISDPALRVSYGCLSSPQTANGVMFGNYSGPEPVNVFFARHSSSSTQHHLLEPGGLTSFSLGVQSIEHVTFQAQGTNLATIEVFTVERTSDCHAQAQALVTR